MTLTTDLLNDGRILARWNAAAIKNNWGGLNTKGKDYDALR